MVNEPTPVSPTEGVHYEHSSVPKSLHALFAPNAAPLTAREVFAAPFHTAVLNLDEPRTDCPMTLPTPTSHRELSNLGPIDGHRPLSGLQVRRRGLLEEGGAFGWARCQCWCISVSVSERVYVCLCMCVCVCVSVYVCVT